MRPISLPRLFELAVLSFGLVWVAGAHVHLCFDGQEPPATLHHLAQGGDHLDHHSPEEGHSDSDVEFDTSLTRAPKDGADTPASSASVVSAPAGASIMALVCQVDAPSSVRTASRFRQPPLRAPPA